MIGSCVPVDAARFECDRATADKNTAAILSCVPMDVAGRQDHSAARDVDTTTRRLPTAVVASSDVESDQLHDAQRARLDVQHTAASYTQHHRTCHRRLDDDAPGDAELADEVVGA